MSKKYTNDDYSEEFLERYRVSNKLAKAITVRLSPAHAQLLAQQFPVHGSIQQVGCELFRRLSNLLVDEVVNDIPQLLNSLELKLNKTI